MPLDLSPGERVADLGRTKEDWIEMAKHILIQIHRGDNLEKTLVRMNYEGELRRILIKPTETVEA